MSVYYNSPLKIQGPLLLICPFCQLTTWFCLVAPLSTSCRWQSSFWALKYKTWIKIFSPIHFPSHSMSRVRLWTRGTEWPLLFTSLLRWTELWMESWSPGPSKKGCCIFTLHWRWDNTTIFFPQQNLLLGWKRPIWEHRHSLKLSLTFIHKFMPGTTFVL